MRNRTLLLSLVGLPSLGLLLLSAGGQNQRPGSAIAATRDLRGQMPPGFNQDVAKVVADIDRIETDTLGQMGRTTLDRDGQIHTLGKLMLFDKHLSVNQNEACSFCHTPETGFTGPIQSLNLSTVSYPGSVRTRFSQTKAAELHVRDVRACAPLQRRFKVTSWEGIFGTCAPVAIACRVRAPNKLRVPRRIL